MHRLVVSAKRKVFLNPKTVVIYVFAIFFTFLFAYHQRLNQHQNGHQLNSLRVIQLRTLGNQSLAENQPKVNKNWLEKCEKLPKETTTDFNTFELFEKIEGFGKVVGANANSRQKEKLKVFVLPFTHVDPGWLETFESYTKRTNAILDNMHQFMMKNEEMRFMWAEFVFFERWWSLQTESVRNDVKKLVKEGRLELATGSWVMTDEANPYFPVSIDNIVEGFQFIDQNFGIKPKTMWSNDPFGYSNTVPYLFRKAGVHRAVINRIHHKIKKTLQAHQAIPFNWRQYFDAAGENDVLTQVLPYTHYDILNSCGSDPATCCEFDFKRMTHWNCPGPKPTNITSGNVRVKADKLVTSMKHMAEMYKAPVILMMHGDDFRFDMIEEWHQHHDNFLPLFKEINKGSEVEIRFGTFTDYFDNLEKWYAEHEDRAPPTLSGDFFPYMCALGDYWTGYFTTRPFYKRQGRLLHSLIRSADIMFSMLRPDLKQRRIEDSVEKLEKARRNLALFQHHDAITGTSKVSVMDDYSELLHSSIISIKNVLESLGDGDLSQYPRLHDGVEIQTLLDFKKSNSQRELKLFNSLLFTVDDVFEIRVNQQNVVISIDDKVVEAQIEPFFIKNQPETDSFLVVFRASIPPLSVLKVRVSIGDSGGKTQMAKLEAKEVKKWTLGSSWTIETPSSPSELSLKTQFLTTIHNSTTGSLQKIIKTGSTFDCKQTWQKYRDASGGAYLMKLHNNPMEMTDFTWLKVTGPIRQSILQSSDTVFQRTTAKAVDGPIGEELDISLSIDISQYRNTELMTRFTTDWDAPLTYTDSIGMQLIRRQFYQLPVQENYYPMPTAAVIEKGKDRISIVSNVEHGARFMERGTVEINIDRMLNQDDGKGLGRGKDAIPVDLKPLDLRLRLVFERIDEPPTSSPHYSTHSLRAQQAVQRVIYPTIGLSGRAENEEDVTEIDKNSGLTFPCDIQLITIRPLSDNRQLLILFRHASTCVQKDFGENCGAEFQTSLFNFLLKLQVKRVQMTDLSGVTTIGEPQKIENLQQFDLKMFDFLTFVLYR